MNERRQFSRVNFPTSTELIMEGTRYSTKLIDISMKGALTEIPSDFQPQKQAFCELELSLDNSPIVISMEVEVAHVERGTIGLRCVGIDLESMTHLRRLLELNLGDAHLLERELFQLGDDKKD